MRAAKAGVLILQADEQGPLVDAAHFPSACIPWQDIKTACLRTMSTSVYLLVCFADGSEHPLYLTQPWHRRGLGTPPKPYRFGSRPGQQPPDYFALERCSLHFHDRQIIDGILLYQPSHS